jgi:hypothetical protein
MVAIAEHGIDETVTRISATDGTVTKSIFRDLSVRK